jgi:hypothetical protein
MSEMLKYLFVIMTIITVSCHTNKNARLNSNIVNPEVEKLIAKCIQANGGINALKQMQSISRSGSIKFYQSKGTIDKFCYQTNIIYPSKLREQIKDINKKQIIYDRGTDGTRYWLWNNNQYEFTDDEALKHYMKTATEQANRNILWIAKDINNFDIMSSIPDWAPKFNQCIQQKAIQSADIRRIYCFDNFSGLLSALGSDKEYRLESDWRNVGNIKLPFHLTQYQQGNITYEVQLDHAELNSQISALKFTKPDSPEFNCI